MKNCLTLTFPCICPEVLAYFLRQGDTVLIDTGYDVHVLGWDEVFEAFLITSQNTRNVAVFSDLEEAGCFKVGEPFAHRGRDLTVVLPEITGIYAVVEAHAANGFTRMSAAVDMSTADSVVLN